MEGIATNTKTKTSKKSEWTPKNRIDYTGCEIKNIPAFDNPESDLTVVGYDWAESQHRREKVWKVQCSCGNEFSLPESKFKTRKRCNECNAKLTSERTTEMHKQSKMNIVRARVNLAQFANPDGSVGYAPALTGDVPGSTLRVIATAPDYITPKGQKIHQYLCLCDPLLGGCGKHVVLQQQKFRGYNKNSTVKSCGCKRCGQRKNVVLAEEKDINGNIYFRGKTTNTNETFFVSAEDADFVRSAISIRNEKSVSTYGNRIGDHLQIRYKTESGETVQKAVHRALLKSNEPVLYKNGNRKDNRRSNLEKISGTEARFLGIKECVLGKRDGNQSIKVLGVRKLTSKKKGVYYDVTLGGYAGKGTILRLGKFTDEKEAIKARLNAELQYLGKEFAPQAFLFSAYGIA